MLIPFESVIGSTKNHVERAKSIISSGFTRGSYPTIFLNNISWNIKDKRLRSWNYHIQSWAMLEHLLLAHSTTQDLFFLEPALKVALEWVELHLDNEGSVPKKNTSEYTWYDMAVGLRAIKLAYILDASIYYDLLDNKNEKRLWNALNVHSDYLRDDRNIAFHSNHGYYQAVGQMAMGRRFKNRSKEMMDSYYQGVERFEEMLNLQFTHEGVHKEHSPDYHRMVYKTLKNVLDSNLIKSQDILNFTKKIEVALTWFVAPSGCLVSFGDSVPVSMIDTSRNACRKWITPEMQYIVSAGKEGKNIDRSMIFFKDSGYAIYKKDKSYLAFNGAFHSRTHKHSDDLSFVWHEFNEEILIDSGKYGYIDKTEPGSDLWLQGFWYADPIRMYCESTRAHNTLEFDDNDYPRRNVKPYGNAINEVKELDGDLKIIVAEHKVFKTIKRRRTIVYKPSKWLIVLDWFKDYSGKKHDVKQWFNFSPNINVKKELGYLKCESLKLNHPIMVSPLFEETSISKVFFGTEEPRKKGWSSPADGKIEKNPSVYFLLKNKSYGNIGTLFNCVSSEFVGKSSQKPNIINKSGRQTRITWTDNDGTHCLELDLSAATKVDYQCSPLKNKINKESDDIVIGVMASKFTNASSDSLTINVSKKYHLKKEYRFLLYDNLIKKYIVDRISQPDEILVVDKSKLDLQSKNRYKYKFRIKDENNRWIDSNYGFNNLLENGKAEDLLQYLHFINSDFNKINLKLFDDKKIAWAVRSIVKDGQYFLLQSPSLLKAKKILLYVNRVIKNEFIKHSDILYLCGFLSTLSKIIIKSDIGKITLTEEELMKIEVSYNDEAFKVGHKMAVAHYISSIDRKKAYNYYQYILKNNYSIVENYLTVDAITTYFLNVSEDVSIRKLEPIMEFNYKERQYNICISSDIKYFKAYMYAWTQYAIYFPEVNFHILLICEDKEVFLSLVNEYDQYLSAYTSFLKKETSDNIKFYFMRDEGNRTLYACGRFYLARHLFERGVDTLYISDIDQIAKGNIKKYLSLLCKKGGDVSLPISGGLLNWLPWRSYLAGNVFLRNTKNGREFIDHVVYYSEKGLKEEKSWMLDQNALAYAQSYVPVEHLHLIGDRIFQQFSELSRLFES